MNHGVSATLASSFGDRRFMASADLAILGIIGLSAVLSLFRGFVREAISLAGWIAGFWLAFNYMHVGAAWFADWVDSPFLRLALGFVVLLGAVLVAAGVTGRLAGKLVNVTGLGGTDRVLGMIFGVGRGAVIVAGLVLVAGFTDVVLEPWWRESVLIPRFEALSAEVVRILPDDIAHRIRR